MSANDRERAMQSQYNRSIFIFASIFLYLACMPLDSFCINNHCGDWPAWSVLLAGPLAMMAPANLTWLANPLLFCAWGCTFASARTAAIVAAVSALALATSFLAFKTAVTNEAGIEMPITGYAPGYWLWLGSMVFAVISAYFVVPGRIRQ
jgi:hypothetical protein